jgi:hypothetical protein
MKLPRVRTKFFSSTLTVKKKVFIDTGVRHFVASQFQPLVFIRLLVHVHYLIKSQIFFQNFMGLSWSFGTVAILQQKIFTMDNAVVIFGSSFPSDQEYTQVIVTLF